MVLYSKNQIKNKREKSWGRFRIYQVTRAANSALISGADQLVIIKAHFSCIPILINCLQLLCVICFLPGEMKYDSILVFYLSKQVHIIAISTISRINVFIIYSGLHYCTEIIGQLMSTDYYLKVIFMGYLLKPSKKYVLPFINLKNNKYWHRHAFFQAFVGNLMLQGYYGDIPHYLQGIHVSTMGKPCNYEI